MELPSEDVESIIIGDRVAGELTLARKHAESDSAKAIRCLAAAIEELQQRVNDMQQGLNTAFPK
jgi:hypothetical protein